MLSGIRATCSENAFPRTSGIVAVRGFLISVFSVVHHITGQETRP